MNFIKIKFISYLSINSGYLFLLLIITDTAGGNNNQKPEIGMSITAIIAFNNNPHPNELGKGVIPLFSNPSIVNPKA